MYTSAFNRNSSPQNQPSLWHSCDSAAFQHTQQKHFVDPSALSEHLSLTRRQILETTRRGMIPARKMILSLCDHTGNWSRPYAEDPEYEVIKVDLLDGQDVRLLPFIDRPVHGILAAPPCNHFAGSGAPSWKRKGEDKIIEGMQIVDSCLRAVAIYKPAWWALENPVGRLKNWIGPWAWTFNPCDYGGYLQPGEKTVDDPLFPANDAYTKLTCIWGTAVKPLLKPVQPLKAKWKTSRDGHRYQQRSNPSHESHRHRSVTPLGFSLAFKMWNP